MICPACNTHNSATSVRCIQCGTTLIHEAVGHSTEYRKVADAIDNRMLGGIGAISGFFLVAVMLKFVFTSFWLSDRQIYGLAVGGGFVGGILGRLFASFRRRGL